MMQVLKSVFSPNKTSARLMVDFSAGEWGGPATERDSHARRRHLLVFDLYIKARSYAIINKCAFWLAIGFGLLVVCWPSISVVLKDFGKDHTFLASAIVQTSVTGIAALAFALYSHYKKRQMQIENLMRHAIHSDEPHAAIVTRVLADIERIDAGFTFSEGMPKGKPL